MHRTYTINERTVDAEYFAAVISDLFAAGWKLLSPEQMAQLQRGNVTDETVEEAAGGRG